MQIFSEFVSLPKGLTAFLLEEGPDMWHEFALGLDWGARGATIDLLLAADRICRHPDCDPATAAVLLAKALAAGFAESRVPPGYDENAAWAFTLRLGQRLTTAPMTPARFRLPPAMRVLVDIHLGPDSATPLPALPNGTRMHRPAFAFLGARVLPGAPALHAVG